MYSNSANELFTQNSQKEKKNQDNFNDAHAQNFSSPFSPRSKGIVFKNDRKAKHQINRSINQWIIKLMCKKIQQIEPLTINTKKLQLKIKNNPISFKMHPLPKGSFY